MRRPVNHEREKAHAYENGTHFYVAPEQRKGFDPHHRQISTQRESAHLYSADEQLQGLVLTHQ
jgi:hypothetical protein